MLFALLFAIMLFTSMFVFNVACILLAQKQPIADALQSVGFENFAKLTGKHMCQSLFLRDSRTVNFGKL